MILVMSFSPPESHLIIFYNILNTTPFNYIYNAESLAALRFKKNHVRLTCLRQAGAESIETDFRLKNKIIAMKKALRKEGENE